MFPVASAVGAMLVLTAGIAVVRLELFRATAARPAAGSTGPATPDMPSGQPSSTPAAASPTPEVSKTPACPFAVSGGVCPPPPPAPSAPGKTWQVSFAEEFTGSSYDRAKLTPCFDWNYGACTNTFNNGREHYQPSQVVVSNGTAKLIAAPLNPPFESDSCQNGKCTYQAGLLSTARAKADSRPYLFAFTYGYVEARLKFPATQGFFTAFWMLPADRSYTYPVSYYTSPSPRD